MSEDNERGVRNLWLAVKEVRVELPLHRFESCVQVLNVDIILEWSTRRVTLMFTAGKAHNPIF